MPLTQEQWSAYEANQRRSADEAIKAQINQETVNNRGLGSMTSSLNKYNYNRQKAYLDALVTRETLGQNWMQTASQRELARAQAKHMADEDRRGTQSLALQQSQQERQEKADQARMEQERFLHGKTRELEERKLTSAEQQAERSREHATALQGGQIAATREEGQLSREQAERLQQLGFTHGLTLQAGQIAAAREEGQRSREHATALQTAQIGAAREEGQFSREHAAALQAGQIGATREEGQRAREHAAALQAGQIAATREEGQLSREQAERLQQQGFTHGLTLQRETTEAARREAQAQRAFTAQQDTSATARHKAELEQTMGLAKERMGLEKDRFEYEKRQDMLRQMRELDQDTINEKMRTRQMNHSEFIDRTNANLKHLELQLDPKGLRESVLANSPYLKEANPSEEDSINFLSGILRSTDDRAYQDAKARGLSDREARLAEMRMSYARLSAQEKNFLHQRIAGTGLQLLHGF